MNTREASARIGERILARVGPLSVVCEILDHRLLWGADQYLVSPAEGRGGELITDQRILRLTDQQSAALQSLAIKQVDLDIY